MDADVRILPSGRGVDAPGRRARDLQVAEPGRALAPGRDLTQLGQGPRGLAGIQVHAVPAVGGGDRPAVRGRGMPADHDRRMRPLDRRRALVNAGKRHKAPAERRLRIGPQDAHRGQVLIGAGASLGHLHAQRPQLRLHVSDAEAGDQPAPGQDVDRRQLPGQEDGLTLGQHDHPEPEPHRHGHCGEVAHRHHDLQPGLLAVPAGQGDVVADPHRLEPGVFRQLSPPGQRARVDVAPQQPVQAEFEPIGHVRSSVRPTSRGQARRHGAT